MTGNSTNIDVLYVLGNGSKWNNNELRYSIRSLVQHLKGFRNIYIVGEKPSFIQNIKYIPFPDKYNMADANITAKVLRAIEEKDLSETFLFINDDHFIVKDINVSEFPSLHKGDLRYYPDDHFTTSNPWRIRLQKTMFELRKLGFSSYNFDIHTPMLFNKTKYVKVMKRFDWDKGPFGFTMKSLYGNVALSDEEKQHVGDLKKKVFTYKTYGEIDQLFKEAFFVSVNDSGLNANMKYYLYKRFPNMSQYEKADIEHEKHIEIMEFLEHAFVRIRNEKKKPVVFKEAAELFNKYGPTGNIRRVINTGYSNTKLERVLYQLRKTANNNK